MSLYENWQALSSQERTPDEYNDFWNAYLPLEQSIYEKILENPSVPLTGTVKELATTFDMSEVIFVGFLDGINTSLVNELILEEITETSSLELLVDLETLYYNMLVAQADWLYNLPSWDLLLSESQRKEIKKDFNKTKTIIKDKKVGRNDPCPCGSGKKYKQCCLNN